MGLQLVVGGSGAGKSEYIYKDIISESMANPGRNYIVVVPEQYTMATQKKLVNMHPNKGILNIDVVSFDRLAYKVFEEIGGENRLVLDDTGKNLIVRKVLEDKKAELRFFGKTANRMGFVSEMKSVISELLQYDIDDERLSMIMSEETVNDSLRYKLNDIKVVYKGFKEYLSNHYITSEEILDVLCQVIERSDMITDSQIVFDGFTGFTPIQYKLLRLLLVKAKDICVSVTIDPEEKLNVYFGPHDLFAMSKEMAAKLMKICDDVHVEVKKPVVLGENINYRFGDREDINYLEKHLFRMRCGRYDKDVEHIRLYEAASRKEEINYCIGEIIRLTGKEGYHYRDIAIVSGDIASYGTQVANVCQQNNIPVFVDHKSSVTDNPAVEFIRGALEVIEKNFSYDSVFRYLKTGMTGIDRDDIDMIENYCIAVGVRGIGSWEKAFVKKGRRKNGYDLVRLNEIRNEIVTPFIKLNRSFKDKQCSVRDYVTALYEFMAEMKLSDSIDRLALRTDTGNEYEQLYKKIIELLDRIVELLGDEHVSQREFNRIVDAGFEEIKVGLIPPTSDCLMVGDIERTRLDDVKVLFFLGINDGVVPKKNENKSVLSETDRDLLESMDVTLSPTVREKAFVQRFYLYLILTKMSDRLYISYAQKGSDGKALLPSYLIRNIRQMFPRLRLEAKADYSIPHRYIRIPKSELEWSRANCFNLLADNIAMLVYGNELAGSVSAFEAFSSCRFAYFMQYGLGLEDREQYRFEANDFGTVIHSVLEQISNKLMSDRRSVSLLDDEERRKLVEECIKEISETYGDTILKDTDRNKYLIKRMSDLADRTLWAVGRQLASGTFAPLAYERKFIIDSQAVAFSGREGYMSVRGKIDRIDMCEDDENVYIRVIDYKTGKSDFDLTKTYLGLKMQLVMYMHAAKLQLEKRTQKNIVPAGMLYYNVDNPLINSDTDEEDVIQDKILETLKMKGQINDNERIVRMMDSECEGRSWVIPAFLAKDGTVKGDVMSTEQFNLLEDYVMKKSLDLGKSIMSGDISVNPYKDGQNCSCTYCAYSSVCGFSPDLYDGDYRKVRKVSDETVWDNIKKGVDENGRKLD